MYKRVCKGLRSDGFHGLKLGVYVVCKKGDMRIFLSSSQNIMQLL
jgi:hypothetical protein